MLSIRLVQLIETHWEEIAARLSREVQKHPHTRTLARRPEAELRVWCREILENLGHLLAVRREEEVQRCFRVLGSLCFEEEIPLHEAVLRLQMSKSEIFSFVHEQGFAMTVLELYREEELQVLVGGFFDACVTRSSADMKRLCTWPTGWRSGDRYGAMAGASAMISACRQSFGGSAAARANVQSRTRSGSTPSEPARRWIVPPASARSLRAQLNRCWVAS